jgi:hypothetical protein
VNSEFVGLSVMEFLKALILEGQDKKVLFTSLFHFLRLFSASLCTSFSSLFFYHISSLSIFFTSLFLFHVSLFFFHISSLLQVDLVCKEFGVSESKLWYAKLLTLAEKQKWDLLKKVRFVLVCLFVCFVCFPWRYFILKMKLVCGFQKISDWLRAFCRSVRDVRKH